MRLQEKQQSVPEAVPEFRLLVNSEYQISLCGIRGGKSGTGTGFPPRPSVSSSQSMIPSMLHIHTPTVPRITRAEEQWVH